MPLLPLFPLNVVLFPGATLPLRIFEPRYRLMIGECIDEKRPFGIVLIRSGREVGAPAEPFEVGTTARITRVEQLPDGRMNIVVLGAERFKILLTDRSKPYLQAEVEYLPRDDAGIEEDDLTLVNVRSLFDRYCRITLALGEQWTSRIGMPSKPARLVDFIAGRLEVNAAVKQGLLESDSVRYALQAESAILEQAVEALAKQLQLLQNKKFRDFGRLN
jgi:Lon protease-like protein